MISRADHVLDYVDDYLHDLLDPADAATVARHCAACTTCAAALAEARKRLVALRSVPPTEAPDELVRETIAGVAGHERRRRWRRGYVLGGLLGALATAAAVIAAFHLHYANLSATPADLKVLGQSRLLAGAAASLRVCLLDHRSGAALAGVPVRVALRHRGSGEVAELARFTTDAEGTGQPRFRVPEWGGADCDLQVTSDDPAHEAITYPVKVYRSRQVMLSSDKPVYQPGQTIRLRSLALRRPDLHPVAGEDATFTITDPKENVIFKHTTKNSAYGIASTDCPLATEILEGTYVIECRVGDTASGLNVEVRKYVLPKFKVGVALDKPYYAPGERVTTTVEASYFFGKPVAGGTAELEVTGTAKQPLHRAGARTDGAGKAAFAFELPRDVGDSRISVLVTVTDTAGQKQSRSVSCVVTSTPLKIEVIPEDGSLVAGVGNTVYVLTTYADGRPARTRLDGLESFREGVVSTDDLGVASFLAVPGPAGLNLTLTATDERGLRATKQLNVACGKGADDFLFRTDKAVYDGGDTMTVTVLGGGTEPVFVDLLKDDQTLLTASVVIANGRREAQIDLPPELSGTAQLCAYRLDAQGVRVSKLRTLYVRAATNLQVKARTDQPEYRPGRKAKLSFELLDRAGRPARGALSLAAVDEAVFAVLPRAPGSEERFFGVEQQLLRPVQALYPWSPERRAELPAAERDRLEQALFARTAETTAHGGSPHSLSASSFQAKAQQVARERSRQLDRVHLAWVLLVLTVLVTAYALMWLYVRPWYLIAVFHGAGLVFLCGSGLMYSVLQVRSEAMKSAGMAADAQSMLAQGLAAAPGEATRLRQDFPETLLWRPELVTDDDGRASLDLDLADSITTWRLTASAVAADGRLGATQAGIKVFQPFFVDLNLPVALTRGDEVAVPVVVYNYLDKPQTVELALVAGDWFERLDEAARKIELAPREVRSTSYRLRAREVGKHALQVTAKGGDLSDAIKREVEVVPDGRRVEQVANGTLAEPAEMTLVVPEDAVPGSAKAFVKIYPSSFSQLVEGLDGIFHMPYGCFEQTSSTTYPNVLALEYLRQTGRAAPEVEAKARQYIHLGYQRLLGFEVPRGGFDWYGRPPANRTLTAYGLMEFTDMAKVYPVDPRLIERTRTWLLGQRGADGSWAPDPYSFAGNPGEGRGTDLARLGTTAYVAWAVFGTAGSSGNAEPTRGYLLSHPADSLNDPYLVALVASALSAIDPDGPDAVPYLERLDSLKKPSEDRKLFFWEQPDSARTAFCGAGRGGRVETTALAALALLQRKRSPETTRRALAWLVQQRGAAGTWPSTQATVLALKALLAGSGKPAGEGERRIRLTWDGAKQEVVIPADQAEVMKQIDLSAGLKPGTHRLTLTETSRTAAGYQVAFRYHVAGADQAAPPSSLQMEMAYDRTEVRVGETVKATVRLMNRGRQAAPMVILDLPLPAGFEPDADGLAGLLKDSRVEKYQVGARNVVVYLRGLEPGQPLELKYSLRATMPVKVSVPPARAYEYYDPDRQGSSAAARLVVTNG